MLLCKMKFYGSSQRVNLIMFINNPRFECAVKYRSGDSSQKSSNHQNSETVEMLNSFVDMKLTSYLFKRIVSFRTFVMQARPYRMPQIMQLRRLPLKNHNKYKVNLHEQYLIFVFKANKTRNVLFVSKRSNNRSKNHT